MLNELLLQQEQLKLNLSHCFILIFVPFILYSVFLISTIHYNK